MNIEKIKDLMTKNFIFCQLKDTVLKFQGKVSQQRLAMRSSITSRPINLVTIVSLLPFFLGFYDFLNQNKQLKKSLFQINIPVFDIPTETLHWDTIRYLSENKKEFLGGIEKIEWSNDSLFLTKTLKTPIGEEIFIACFPENSQKDFQKYSHVSSLVENSTYLQEFRENQVSFTCFNKKAPGSLKKSIYFFDLLQNFYLKLDEIPLKLDTLIFHQIPIGNNKISQVSINDNQTFLQVEEKTNKSYIDLGFQQTSSRESLNLPFQKKHWRTNNNRISLKQKNSVFSSTKTEKVNSIDFLSESFLKNKSLSNNLTKNQLPALNQIHTSQHLHSKTALFGTEKFVLKKAFYDLKASSIDLFSEKQIKDLQTVSMELQEILGDIDQVFFEKGFSSRRKMAGYLYPDMNVQKVSRFFLHNLFSSFSQNIGLQNSTQIVLKSNFPANQNFLLFSNPKISNIKTDIRPFNFQEDDDKIFVYKDLPFFLRFKNGIEFNAKLDYLYSPEIFTTQIKPLSSLYGEFFNEGEKSIAYKKFSSLFNKRQVFEKSFFESWEPVTFRSWLIVSQIGFAVLVFYFLKALLTEYFNELLWFILDFLVHASILDEKLKEEIDLLTGKNDKGFRLISESTKKFKDIAGLKKLLPEIAEIVWFLRNSGKEFSLSKNFPRGILLIGPPGTGKTILVQALAGEAAVPVLALSGSSLVAPGESGGLKLELMFQEARQVAPCIVFIDEIDSLGQKRQGVMQNPMGGDELLSALEPINPSLDVGKSDFLTPSQTSFFKKSDQIAILAASAKGFDESLNLSPSQQRVLEIKQQIHAQEKSRQEQLTLLVQLLIELDGIQGRKGVIVIGATNRPELLDAALIRPGRFDKMIELGMPNHEKRLEIFELYSKKIGADPTISWDYLSKRTIGFTAADLASIMNQSSIKAILNDTENPKHTLQTIEHGIDRITTSEIEKPTPKVSRLFRNQVAYYQAGKVLLSTILESHPPTLVSYLWPRRPNRRSLQILINLQKYFFQFARRCQLEDRIIGCYGGKVAEILFLENYSIHLSTFGLEDLNFAFVLICFTIEKWYFYSKSTIISKLTQILPNKNLQELPLEKIELFKELSYSMELSPDLLYSHETDITMHPFSQSFFSSAWWQRHVSQEFEFVQRNFVDWYRIYLPNPEETELNIDWSPPDDFYHKNESNKALTEETSVTWNDLARILRDYQVHGFVLQSFNQALSLVDDNREFLDKLVFELLKTEVLREPEIDKIAAQFRPFTPTTKQNSTSEPESSIKIVKNSFGLFSRRNSKNWIDFKDFQN